MTPFFKILIFVLVLVAGALIAFRKFPGLSPRLVRLREQGLGRYYTVVLGGFAVVLLLIYLTISQKVAIGLAIVIGLYLFFRRGFPWVGKQVSRLRLRDPFLYASVLRGFLILLLGGIGAVFTGTLFNFLFGAAVVAFIASDLIRWIVPEMAAYRAASPRAYRRTMITLFVFFGLLFWVTVSVKVPITMVLVYLGYLLTMKVIPWLATHIGRRLGFRMEVTPLTARRIQRFRLIRRGYVCFVIITTAFVLSLFLELYVNKRPLYISWAGETWEDANGDGAWQEGEALADRNGNGTWDGPKTLYPAVADWFEWVPFVSFKESARAVAEDFGLKGKGEVPYRTYARWVADPNELDKDADKIEAGVRSDERRWRASMEAAATRKGDTFDPNAPLPEYKSAYYAEQQAQADWMRGLKVDFEAGRASIVMTLLPYSHDEQMLDLEGSPPHKAFSGNPAWPVMGTDFEGKEVSSQLLYGFRVSFLFAVVVAFIGFSIGISIGAIMGYFGGWVDIIVQRIIEVWSSIPFLFTLMILGSITTPSFLLLAVMLVLLRSWLGITYTIRGEYYREKSRDYVQAARALGVRRPKIMARHIFPNALVPVVTFMPFAIVSYIGILVSLDYLGFGLGPEVPSWGSLLKQGGENIVNNQQLIYWPILAFAGTLFCVVMVGEAVREAFDPKLYSRLR